MWRTDENFPHTKQSDVFRRHGIEHKSPIEYIYGDVCHFWNLNHPLLFTFIVWKTAPVKLCSTEERKSFRMTKGWVNDNRMFILEWTVLQHKRPELAQVKRDPKSPAAVKSIGNFSQNLMPTAAARPGSGRWHRGWLALQALEDYYLIGGFRRGNRTSSHVPMGLNPTRPSFLELRFMWRLISQCQVQGNPEVECARIYEEIWVSARVSSQSQNEACIRWHANMRTHNLAGQVHKAILVI